MSASGVAIISFAAILLILFGLLFYKYYKNKNEAGDQNIIFNFNVDVEKDQTNDREFVIVKNANVRKQSIVDGGFKYTNDFSGTFIFALELELSEILRDKEILKVVHTDNEGTRNEYETDINKDLLTQNITIVPFNNTIDLRGFHYFDIYVDNKFYGTKSYKIMEDEADFIISSNYDAVDMNPTQLIVPETFSYKIEYSSIPVISIKPALNKSTYDSPKEFKDLLNNVRFIQANNSGGVKIQSHADENLFLTILTEPYNSLNINYKVAGFKQSTLENASVFYIHNVSNDNNYADNTEIDYSDNNLIKIGDKSTGEECYFMFFKTDTRFVDQSFLSEDSWQGSFTNQRGVPMVLWKDINQETCGSIENVKWSRTNMLFRIEDLE